MFIQVIRGRTGDTAGLRAALDRWVAELSGSAPGWLGTTAGVTDDGTFVNLARFESEEAARANSERPEQGAWWQETSKLLTGDVIFHDCHEVIPFLGGGSDDAGFVQVIEGKVRNVSRMRELNDLYESEFTDFRPDVIGGIAALWGEGSFTQAIYFTSEEEAREGERKQPPSELKALFDEEMSLYEGDLVYYDLRDPWLASAR
ncbi:hypothetical protein [Nonomuraea africana]|uniref:ABM domain-containing protein n=1 Tax=Nonomuraea africana TaxID=46171 RepID=A0ABR9K7V8_9ACTN|nr:hypothetical protein [Nonomuraea africana]MBE1557891.1 hypothetical protein [Nonomuraea africana]